MEMLDALRADGDRKTYFQEFPHALKRLEQSFWSLSGAQAGLYATQLLEGVDAVLKAAPPVQVPGDFESRVDELREPLERKLELWRMAEMVRTNVLPGVGNKRGQGAGEGLVVHKEVFEFEGEDVLALLAFIEGTKAGSVAEYLGSLVRIEDLREPLDTLLAQNCPPGLSVLFSSTLSERVVYGLQPAAGSAPALSDIFPENFPPWKMEVFQDGGRGGAIPLYKNIFFWTILALLVIVIFGSGLMIRMIIQEVNLLNLKSEFIASVSHEFKTPLTAMGAILERLLNREVNDPRMAREYYRLLSQDSDRLKRLVKNILDFTKIEDGKREYKRTAVDLGRLVRQEIECFQNEHEPSGFKVDVKVEGDILAVVADEDALRQALHNILDNAAKFSGRRKGIEVTVVRRGEGIEIAVRDHGVGIPECEQKKVFDKFFRGKMASSVSPTGTGLGLTLVKHIMDAHGGEVVISSRPGEGSRVSLILPFGKEAGR
jgi:signal transduction histidine kinase